MADEKPTARKIRLLDGALTLPFATQEAGGWAALTGTVRPAAPREVTDHFARLAKVEGAAGRAKAQAEFYAKLLRTWDVPGPDGTPAPISAETVGQLPFPVWSQLENICLGYLGSDLLKN